MKPRAERITNRQFEQPVHILQQDAVANTAKSSRGEVLEHDELRP